jgi:outer membrane protein OmpA-like peptidoglycan-associated protein
MPTRLLPIFAAAILVLVTSSAQASSCGWETELQFEPGADALSAEQKAVIVGAFEKLERTSKVLQVWAVTHADRSEGKSENDVFQLSVRRARAIGDYVGRIRPEFKGNVGVDARGYQPKLSAGSSQNRRAQLVMTCPAFMAPPRSK